MSKSSSLSVVVPAFNEEVSIARCLDHLLNQSRPIDEIIVVDNASTDRTSEILAEYAAEFEVIVVVHEAEKGVIAAIRTGFDRAKSDILARTDGDSLVHPDWAAQLTSFLDSDVGADYVAVTGLLLAADGPAYDRLHRLTLASMGKLRDGGEIESVVGANFAIRAWAWHKVKDQLTHRLDVWDDFDLGLALRESGLKKYFLPQMIVDTSMRQFRHSPWENRHYLMGGIRTARSRGNRKVAALMVADLPFRLVTFTAMWLVFRPWDTEQQNWRPHRLFVGMDRERALITDGR